MSASGAHRLRYASLVHPAVLTCMAVQQADRIFLYTEEVQKVKKFIQLGQPWTRSTLQQSLDDCSRQQGSFDAVPGCSPRACQRVVGMQLTAGTQQSRLTDGFPVGADEAIWPGILFGGDILLILPLCSLTPLTTCMHHMQSCSGQGKLARSDAHQQGQQGWYFVAGCTTCSHAHCSVEAKDPCVLLRTDKATKAGTSWLIAPHAFMLTAAWKPQIHAFCCAIWPDAS